MKLEWLRAELDGFEQRQAERDALREKRAARQRERLKQPLHRKYRIKRRAAPPAPPPGMAAACADAPSTRCQGDRACPWPPIPGRSLCAAHYRQSGMERSIIGKSQNATRYQSGQCR